MDAEKLIEEAGRVSATRKWPMYLADLLHSLAAALRETTAREQATIASLRCAEGSLKGYAAANVAANKRIEALEHERDAARAELARPLVCPDCSAKLRRLERMDSAGQATYELGKARKEAAGQMKRAQKLEQEAKGLHAELMQAIAQTNELRAELARLTTPRPIAEAPKDGTWILGVWLDSHASVPTAIRWVVDAWADESQENLKEPTHYLPLPDVKP